MSQRHYKRRLRRASEQDDDPELTFALEADVRLYTNQTTPEDRAQVERLWQCLFGIYAGLLDKGAEPKSAELYVKTEVYDRLKSGPLSGPAVDWPIQFTQYFLGQSRENLDVFLHFVLTDEHGASIMTQEEPEGLKRRWAAAPGSVV